MHRYYVHAFSSILQHQPGYELYQVRHPFPPYATHYFLLLGLSQLVSFDLAEKLFVCLTILLFAAGLRMTATAVGPCGEWVSLFVAPLLLSWSLMMGFFNYVFGIGLVLLATAFWQRSRNGKRWSILWYLLVLTALTFTHPVPLLLLIFLIGIDLLLNAFLRPPRVSLLLRLRAERLRIAAFVCTILAVGFPMTAVDNSATNMAKTLSETHFKPEYVRTGLLLTGISPYNTRTHDLWLNGYRIALYAILIGGVFYGGRASLRALRERRTNLGTTLCLAIPVLLIALPILPNQVNGSFYFSTRLIMVLWPAALIAAAAAREPSRKQQMGLLTAACVCSVLTLVSAQKFFRPVAHELKTAEAYPMPDHQQGIVLLGDGLGEYARFSKELAFDPYRWAPLLAADRHNDVVLDAPWMDQKIAPLAPAPASPLLLADVSATHSSKEFPPLVKGRSLPAFAEADLVRRSSYLVFAGAPAEIAQGLSTQLSPEEASSFSCVQAQVWSLICTRK